MTRKDWEDRLPLVIAYVLGETVEYWEVEENKWYENDNLNFSYGLYRYRIAKDDGTYVYFDKDAPRL
jgi:hypothetical protein